nr:MAG TPA: hypothetical protein [Caudoviricetes sp.]
MFSFKQMEIIPEVSFSWIVPSSSSVLWSFSWV